MGVSAQLLLAVAGAVSLAGPIYAQPVFRAGVDVVTFGVTVIDRKGELVTDLGADDFEVIEGKTPQQIRFFTRADAGGAPPLHAGLLFDTSSSMTDDIKFARSAAVKFLKGLERAADMTLVDFDTEVRVTQFGPHDFPRLVERLRSRKPDGWTALYDALIVYLDGAQREEGQKVLVLYTDGGDTRSTATFAETIDLLKASDVTLYAIGFLEHQSASTRFEQRLRLQQLAEASGGFAFFPSSPEQLDEVYGKILLEVSGRYLIGYVSGDTRTDGAWREVTVRLKRAGLREARVRTRKGYFAPYRETTRREP